MECEDSGVLSGESRGLWTVSVNSFMFGCC